MPENSSSQQREIPLPVLTGNATSSNPVLLRRQERQAVFLLAFALIGLITPAVYLVGSLVLGWAGAAPSTTRAIGRLFILMSLLSLLCEPVILALSLSLWRGGATKGRYAFVVSLATLLLLGGFWVYLVLRPR